MKKSEVNEIRKQFDHDRCTISRICGCYIDGEKSIKTVFTDSFLTLPEEETFKYFEIFKKTLSGTVGKNLLDIDFPRDDSFENSQNDFLIQLKNSELRDDKLNMRLYEEVIKSFNYAGNYLVLLVYMAYDVPGISNDNLTLEDASDEVYKCVLCSICPVELSKAGLSYQPDENKISHRKQDWVVGMPLNGFLFPAFNERSADVNSILYYSKNPKVLQDELIENLLGCEAPLTAELQKDVFTDIIAETLGDDCDYETVRSINEKLGQMVEESKEELRPPTIDVAELKSVLVESGVSGEKIESLDQKCSENQELAKRELHLSNLVNTRSFEVSTPSISIKVDPDSTHLLETKLVDGRKSIVIPITDEVEVNGVPVKI
ncbi:hypothetical protein EUAN_04080 [Andreesenia angusta]|uniref:DUF4317 domain-containing protein n=1 Tax=Andreesenia angusta TaxID=39480 RepID=A0A1S1VAI9_9FIRM|nr:DUF4317 domain-containing protein [Andreesenia angusta]OHW63544.1 hypothetical protein EUAN_04080 [Andreesenia angusta]